MNPLKTSLPPDRLIMGAVAYDQKVVTISGRIPALLSRPRSGFRLRAVLELRETG